MESLYDKAVTYAKILQNCSLPQVADWGVEDVERAFKWADYFEKIQSRTSDKPSVVRKLDLRLREIGHKLGTRFGEDELCHDFLGRTADYFTKALLDNPVLPKELRETVMNKMPSCTNQHLKEKEDTEELLSTLSTIESYIAGSLGGEESIFCSLKSLDAGYLRKDISWLLAGKDKERPLGVTIEERLTSLAKIEGGMEVILLSVLQSDDNLKWLTTAPSHPDALDCTRRAIYDWIEEVARSNDTPELKETLWRNEHCKLVARLSARYFNFFKIHFGSLVSKTELNNLKAKSMAERSLAENLMLQEEWVISHWVELALAGEITRETCISFLKSRAYPQITPLQIQPSMSIQSQTARTTDPSLWITILHAVTSSLHNH